MNHHCFKRVSLQSKNSVVIRNRKLDSNVRIISTKRLVTELHVNQDHPMHFFPAVCAAIINSCIERKKIEDQLHNSFDSGKND